MRNIAVVLMLITIAMFASRCGDEVDNVVDGGVGGGAADSGGTAGCVRDDECAAIERCVGGVCRIPSIPDAGGPDAGGGGDAGGTDAGDIDAGAGADVGGTDAGDIDAGSAEDAGGATDSGADAGASTDAGADDAAADAGEVDAGTDAGTDAGGGDAGTGQCPQGMTCIHTFPFGDDRDTSKEPAGKWSSYSCKASVVEGGNEIVYRVTVPEDGFMSVAVYESAGVDVDAHILSAPDPSACLDRGNFGAKADVTAGVYYVVVDTYSGGGAPKAGAFHVDIGFTAPSRGPCAMQTGEMARVGDGGTHLQMPATGKMVLEAHLVTQGESYRPASSTEHLTDHYALSQSTTGFVMYRGEVWAPLEGGSFYGCGIEDPKFFPVVDESWYINMYWTAAARPARGTKMILRIPGTSRAVVVSAGHETGPGDLSFVGGTPEESHYYLGTAHGSTAQLGIAADQAIPLGPRVCE